MLNSLSASSISPQIHTLTHALVGFQTITNDLYKYLELWGGTGGSILCRKINSKGKKNKPTHSHDSPFNTVEPPKITFLF